MSCARLRSRAFLIANQSGKNVAPSPISSERQNLQFRTKQSILPVRKSNVGRAGTHSSAWRIEDPDIVPETGIYLASLLDLAGGKVGVVKQRAEAKDYIDIVSIIRSGVNLSMALSAGRAVYGTRFDPIITLRALTTTHLIKRAAGGLTGVMAMFRQLPHSFRFADHPGVNEFSRPSAFMPTNPR
jgi:hypothetical protein